MIENEYLVDARIRDRINELHVLARAAFNKFDESSAPPDTVSPFTSVVIMLLRLRVEMDIRDVCPPATADAPEGVGIMTLHELSAHLNDVYEALHSVHDPVVPEMARLVGELMNYIEEATNGGMV